MQEKRKKWKESIPELPKTKLVFLDESGVNTNMARRYGRAAGKQRVVDTVPLNTPQTTTVLSAMRLDGQFVCRAFEGGTTKDRFLEYLREDLLRSVDAVPLYLPPYSPDFNPIEKMWSRMKVILRKMRVRSQILLDDAVRLALLSVSSDDCDAWFRCAGY